MEIMDSLDKLKIALKETRKKVEFVRATPEYAEFEKWREEHTLFRAFIEQKRMTETYSIINELTSEYYGEVEKTRLKNIEEWLERISKLNKRLSNSKYKKGIQFCESNIMDHVWEVFQKYGTVANHESEFGNGSYKIGNYTMETYSGQGEYGYSIYVPKRIY